MNTRLRTLCTTAILGVIAAVSLANAAWMLAAPRHWYDTLPGVVDAGPYNEHFVRDIGCISLTAGVALTWALFSDRYRFPLVAMVTLFFCAHAVLHVFDTARGHFAAHHWWLDFPIVHLPALLLLAVTVSLWRSSERGPPQEAHSWQAR